MESLLFDALTKALTVSLSRRGFLRSLAGGTAGGLIGARALVARADEDVSLVCHDGRSLRVMAEELPAYIQGGDTEGPCCLQTKVCRIDQVIGVTQSGRCSCVCPDGQRSCAGTGVAVESDAANCGVCGVVCADGEVCEAGSCVPVAEEPVVCGPAACDRVLASLPDDDACYAAGGYVVEVEP